MPRRLDGGSESAQDPEAEVCDGIGTDDDATIDESLYPIAACSVQMQLCCVDGTVRDCPRDEIAP